MLKCKLLCLVGKGCVGNEEIVGKMLVGEWHVGECTNFGHLDLPAWHSLHCSEPGTSAKVPGAQGAHSDLPSDLPQSGER